jgi:Fe-S cluster biosynthesis and repair protein YggX
MAESISKCKRCGAQDAPGVDSWVGFTGDLKERIHAEICAACWRAWLDTQLMAINEYRLNLGKPEHRQVLADLATQFFFEPKAPASDAVEGASLEALDRVWTPPPEED